MGVVLAGLENGEIIVLNEKTGSGLERIYAHEKSGLCVCPGEDVIWTSSHDQSLACWFCMDFMSQSQCFIS